MPEIVKLTNPTAKDISELKEIYFESSTRKDFRDADDKEAFFQKYLGHYLTNYPQYVWVAKSDRILGYMVGVPETRNTELYRLQPHLGTFKAHFGEFPAHLHVNFHADARGMGLGSKLFSELALEFQRMKIRGVHIMTSPDARNKSFYQRLGFHFEVTLNFQGHTILLMGKSL
ncbi:MAG: GNAT family N-acetyltransferase [Bdellovibrionota bacterium]